MIEVLNSVIEDVFSHSIKELPNEACGYLAGKDGRISKYFPMKNIDQSPEHFSFDPEEQFNVLRQAQSEGLDILANCHSHPETPARPSQEDVKLAYDAGIMYFIVSLAEESHNIKAFKIIDSKVDKLEIKIYS